MSHLFIKIWIHAVWATKDRQPLIKPQIETSLHQHMYREFSDVGCSVSIINGMPDHIHCLVLMNAQKGIAEVIKQVKDASSHWVNGQNIIADKFAWQTGYGAFSVSESQLEKVFQYIKNQKVHHAKNTFQKEYDEFIKVDGLGNDLH